MEVMGVSSNKTMYITGTTICLPDDNAVGLFYSTKKNNTIFHRYDIRIQYDNEAETRWPPFPDDIFKWIFLNENVWILIKISLKFVPGGTINHIPALLQMRAWNRLGDKQLSDLMMVSLLTHICVTQPQWVKHVFIFKTYISVSSNPYLQYISNIIGNDMTPYRHILMHY